MDAPIFHLGDPVVEALYDQNSPRARAAMNAAYREGPIEIQLGYMSTDPRMVLFKQRFSEAMTAAFPENVDEFGRVFGNGVRSNFFGMRTLNGFPMLPATFPLASNLKRRADLKLAEKPISQLHEWIFRATVRLLASNLAPTDLRLRKGKSSGAPYFDKTDRGRMDIALRSLEVGERAGALHAKGKHQDAWEMFFIGGAAVVVYRSQSTDKISLQIVKGEKEWTAKERLVADLEYARSGGLRGVLRAADKGVSNLELPFSTEGIFRERRRTAMAVQLGINTQLAVVAHPMRKNMYSTYAFTYHHTGRANKEEKVADWENAVAIDVSDHDILWPSSFLRPLICDELREMGFAEWWVAHLEYVLKMPIYVGAPGPDLGKVLIGDWRNPQMDVGLTSGNAMTDILGSIGMTAIYAIMQLDHTAPHIVAGLRTYADVLRFMDSYLKGKEEICQLSKSDDALLGWRQGRALAASKELVAKLQRGEQVSPYMVVGYEHGGAFLGDIMYYDSTRSPRNARFIGNIVSMVNNQFSPEYSVQSNVKDRAKRARPFPGLAWASMKLTYGDCPIYGETLSLIEKEWRHCFGESYEAYREEWLRQDTLALSQYVKRVAQDRGLQGLNYIDLEVLVDPDKMHYKFSEDDVSDDVKAVVTNKISAATLEPIFRKIVP